MQFDCKIWVINILWQGKLTLPQGEAPWDEAMQILLYEPQGKRANAVPEARRAS